jgi:hypothetical protein
LKTRFYSCNCDELNAKNLIEVGNVIVKKFVLKHVPNEVVYQGQKVHLFCPSVGFLAEAQPRLQNRRGQKQFLAEVHIIGIITNLFCIYFFQIDT